MDCIVKKLAASIRQYKLDTALTPFFMIGEVSMEALIPLLMASLIDRGVTGGDMPYLRMQGLLLVIAAFTSMAFGILSGWFAASASAGFARNLRHDMFHNVQTFSFANIDKLSAESLVTRLTTDTQNVQNAFQMLIRMAIRAPFTFVFSFMMAVSINTRLSLIFVAAIPLLAACMYFIMTNVHPIFRRVFKTYDKLNGIVRENLRGIRVVKSFVREDYEVKKFGDVSQKIYDDFTFAERILAFNQPIMQFCIYGSMLLIAWFGARFIVGGTLTTGKLMSLITYTMQILMSLMMVSMIFVMVTMSRASAERICAVLDEQSTLHNPPNPVKDVPNGDIEFRGVSFGYVEGGGDAKLNLLDVNLTIKSGETVGILGGTGSAKSTLVQLIPRLYDATKGTVLVGDRDVREYDLEVLRDAVAFVLQKNVLFSGTIKENLQWGDENATDEEIVHACELAQADGFIREFPEGYDTYIEQGGTNVSGGQRQRLCIARALLKKPRILILDDSTSAVDTRTDAAIRRGFREGIPHITKIIIAQRVASVMDADKILVMDNGRVVDEGPHAELLERCEIYREVYESQTGGGDFDEVGKN